MGIVLVAPTLRPRPDDKHHVADRVPRSATRTPVSSPSPSNSWWTAGRCTRTTPRLTPARGPSRWTPTRSRPSCGTAPSRTRTARNGGVPGRSPYQVGAARSLATTRNLLEDPPPVSIEDGMKEIAESDRRLALAYETVQMLGDEHVGRAAHAFRSALWQLSDYARGLIDVDAAEWEKAYKRYRISRDGFHAAIRHDLGIAGRGYQRNTVGLSSRPPNAGTP